MRRLAIFGVSSIAVGGVALLVCAIYAYGSVRTFEGLTGVRVYDLERLYRSIEGAQIFSHPAVEDPADA